VVRWRVPGAPTSRSRGRRSRDPVRAPVTADPGQRCVRAEEDAAEVSVLEGAAAPRLTQRAPYAGRSAAGGRHLGALESAQGTRQHDAALASCRAVASRWSGLLGPAAGARSRRHDDLYESGACRTRARAHPQASRRAGHRSRRECATGAWMAPPHDTKSNTSCHVSCHARANLAWSTQSRLSESNRRPVHYERNPSLARSRQSRMSRPFVPSTNVRGCPRSSDPVVTQLVTHRWDGVDAQQERLRALRPQ